MTTLRDALALGRLNTMRQRRAQQLAKLRRERCGCAVCAAGGNPLGSLLKLLGSEPEAQPETPAAGTKAH